MNNKTPILGLALLAAFTFANCHRTLGATNVVADLAGSTRDGAVSKSKVVETPAQRDARMAWWRDAKFGMFIHWGVYAVPAGIHKDQPVAGIGEWIMNKGKIPMAEYQSYAKEFNPVKYDADAWVRAAKDAGMKYIVVTTKHHDGFALFDSQANDWNVVKATPYGKDLIRPLAEACRKQGLKLGFYYSQAQDWNNGGSASGGKWDKAQEHDMDDYIDRVAVPQVREICSNYGEFPDVIWWDTPTGMNTNRAQKLYEVVHALKPNVIQNNRLGGGFKGDTDTPEQKIPAQGFPGRDWETCMTMNNTWGFKRNDHDWKSTETLVRQLCDVASKGGNYLLNIGPTSEGLIPQPSLDRLAEVGQWIKVNGEAIYGSSATVFGHELGPAVKAKDGYGKDSLVSSANDWRSTTKPGKIYLLVFKWPANQKFELAGLQSKVKQAYLLADRKALQVDQTETGVSLALPAAAPDKIASVICLELADEVPKVATRE
ncbi:MAG: alpha-L-fucosidase [Verrucomicrobiota bacterium]